ncbi:glycosyl transferase family 1 [Thermopolyspora flexuosa]|uniref:Glycosyltransferase involved in cell wall biosynthesis n=1 Tax=Thermopolyspora flexuosa TaxID=103836 RepID=A0A543ITM5_9ACTN|nr:glycosyltransferase family 4 protein [Thermopolyspora flexuosa]TQM73936.1 glycosyltransferase involved in cell wall biosynthesis [Thermopolyspora flexuosa]GGM93290.1 glycosyl transferase family 1 [Thermopolyspora flexuosa]
MKERGLDRTDAEPTEGEPLRVALLSYRSKPTCGGQGVYLRHLSRELVALGHHVEVFSGQPYPELDEGVILNQVPSLDLYRDEDPFRTPKLHEYRDWIDVLEVATMWTAGFPEPLTFSLRAYRELKRRAGDFDVVQDNQTLGYGILGIQRLFPVVGTIHHPISVDRRIELQNAEGWKRYSLRRWYGFVRMQAYVAARLNPILTVSESSLADIHRDFNVPQRNMRLIPLGVDTRYFHPRPHLPKRPGSIVAVASADSPMKGVATLLHAVAKLATERDVNLTVVSRPTPGGPTERLVQELALGDRVRFVHGISDDELGELIATSEISVVPSLYEGFSLPAVEHMACGTPLIASRTGALPEVVGDAAILVTPGDAEELAAALRRLHDSPELREKVGRAGYDRVQERFTWRVVAKRTVEAYREAIAARAARTARKGAA